MKKLVIFFFTLCLLAFSQSDANAQFASMMTQGAISAADCTLNGYTHCRKIAFQSSQVSTADQTNFPALFLCTSNSDTNCNSVDLRVTGSGGFIQNTTTLNSQTVPADLIFTSDSACSTKLNWEVASYTSTTGAIEVWIQVPTLSHSSNTTIYMCYGKSSVTTYQGSASSTWDSNYIAVYHLANGSSLSLTDSTGAASGTNTGSATATTGKLDGGVAMNGTSNYYTSTPSTNPSTCLTVEYWQNQSSNTTDNIPVSETSNYNSNNMTLNIDTDDATNGYVLNVHTGAVYNGTKINSTPSTSAWHSLAATIDSTAGTGQAATWYLDGAKPAQTQVSSGNLGSSAFPNYTWYFGAFGTGTLNFHGTLDEIKISKSCRAQSWLVTEYNNQNAPGSFYTVGSQN